MVVRETAADGWCAEETEKVHEADISNAMHLQFLIIYMLQIGREDYQEHRYHLPLPRPIIGILIGISTLYIDLLGMTRYAQKMLQSLFYFAVYLKWFDLSRTPQITG
jgi:hypothetical protein